MRRSDAHECRQAYNAQAVVCAEGAQLVLADGVAATAGAPGFASGPAVAALEARGIEPPVAIGRAGGTGPTTSARRRSRRRSGKQTVDHRTLAGRHGGQAGDL